MEYALKFEDQAILDIARLKKSGDKAIIKKLEKLLSEMQEHPRTGTGQVEQLKYYGVETWSRRINHEHRIVYRVYDDIVEVLILSAFGHY